MHGNLTLNTKDMAEGQDIYLGFIFKQIEDESKPVAGKDSQDTGVAEEKTKTFVNGYDGLRTRVKYQKDQLHRAQFNAADLWIDGQETPDIWSKGVLSNHLTGDAVANDWYIVKDDSAMTCDNNSNCRVNVHFMRDFETDDTRDHQLTMGQLRNFQVTAFYSTYNKGSSSTQAVHRGVSQPMIIAMGAMSNISFVAAALTATVTLLSF
jgi:hypothetical protein